MRKKLLVSFLLVALSCFEFFSFVQAASLVATIQMTPPEQMVYDEEHRVTLELLDAEKNMVSGKTPTVTFSPTKSVEDVKLFDCGQEQEADECRANFRGVNGIFESHFILVDSPVTMSVTVDTITQKVVLNGVEASSGEKNIPDSSSVTESFGEISVKDIAEVKVGPTPSVLFLILPFIAIAFVVTLFVTSTHE